jgi:hypothetical protein
MHGDAEEIGGHARNRIQVFDRIIERSALEQGLVDVRQRPAEQDRVAAPRWMSLAMAIAAVHRDGSWRAAFDSDRVHKI